MVRCRLDSHRHTLLTPSDKFHRRRLLCLLLLLPMKSSCELCNLSQQGQYLQEQQQQPQEQYLGQRFLVEHRRLDNLSFLKKGKKGSSVL